jgi:steroid delta-isomerase-like uncharacterized protein
MTDKKSVEARLRVVDDHIRFEEEHALERLVATFGADPEWHNKPGGEVLTGHEAIRGFYSDLFQGFPDFWLDIRQKHVASDAVTVEGVFGGTHRGTWMGIPASGKSVEVPFCVVFTFTADDKLKSEIAYYDRLGLLMQMGVVSLPQS